MKNSICLLCFLVSFFCSCSQSDEEKIKTTPTVKSESEIAYETLQANALLWMENMTQSYRFTYIVTVSVEDKDFFLVPGTYSITIENTCITRFNGYEVDYENYAEWLAALEKSDESMYTAFMQNPNSIEHIYDYLMMMWEENNTDNTIEYVQVTDMFSYPSLAVYSLLNGTLFSFEITEFELLGA